MAVLLALSLSVAHAHPSDDCELARSARELACSSGVHALDGFDALIESQCSGTTRHSSGSVVVPAEATSLSRVPSTRVVIARDTRVQSISNVPSTVEVLDLAGSPVRSIANLPSGLKVLDVSGTNVRSIANLPSGLRVLSVSGTSINSIANLPSGLDVLDISATPIRSLANLPSGLKVLDVSDSAVTRLSNLPSGLRVIDIRGTDIRSLSGLPSGVECVATDLRTQDHRASHWCRELERDWRRL